MRTSGRTSRDLFDVGARARALLQRWLNGAMRLPDGRLPRIPMRRVSEGGFDRLMSTDRGRRSAEQWWMRALSNDDLDPNAFRTPRRADRRRR